METNIFDLDNNSLYKEIEMKIIERPDKNIGCDYYDNNDFGENYTIPSGVIGIPYDKKFIFMMLEGAVDKIPVSVYERGTKFYKTIGYFDSIVDKDECKCKVIFNKTIYNDILREYGIDLVNCSLSANISIVNNTVEMRFNVLNEDNIYLTINNDPEKYPRISDHLFKDYTRTIRNVLISYLQYKYHQKNKYDIETKVKIKYHRELCPELKECEVNPLGNFIDVRAAENVVLKAGESVKISLGISTKVEKGYWLVLVPRSSAFKNFGILMTNSFGVIDTSYSGDNDIWQMSVYATRDTEIHINDRIGQFTLVRDIDFDLEKVDKLDDTDRGGFGTSGIN